MLWIIIGLQVALLWMGLSVFAVLRNIAAELKYNNKWWERLAEEKGAQGRAPLST